MSDPTPEFSRLIHADRIPQAGLEEILEATPAERAALATRFDLIDLPSLRAQLTLKPGLRQTFEMTGRIEVDVVQRCVVTLDPVASHLDMPVDLIFVPAALQQAHESVADTDDVQEDVEYVHGGKIDLGELVAQHLGVNLNPYPRKADAALPRTEFGPPKEETHPFAQLAQLTKPNKNNE